jgi:hypothetical protein
LSIKYTFFSLQHKIVILGCQYKYLILLFTEYDPQEIVLVWGVDHELGKTCKQEMRQKLGISKSFKRINCVQHIAKICTRGIIRIFLGFYLPL